MPEREEPAPADGLHHVAPNAEQLAAAAGVFALMADQTRLHLLWVLAEGEADVTALAAATGAARTAVSQHLAKLRLAGLVQARREGRRAVYSMTDGHLRRLVLEALSRADHQVSGKPWHG
ncbi:ArsR/SmtB family transcription factor [Glycomyces albidus]|jgi:DNA-binding transcriptional ArsR family regulator|uniref:Metalloregulator ArsR/SmtB family transcription factor n=1 Tax=Glycomyces albidus TaxID=2656774 RepID=A0A6L5G7H1_9ACTN|nr:metalloregulator ArsR/SmtB family transcription factor [Glycomyces albidus]MQM25561.1 metalloregulator ArsR/SmtB family transcription factor [Glycomyces albidus]